MSKHYVARIVVEAVEKAEAPTSSSRGGHISTPEPPRRSKYTIGTVTLSGTTLERVVEQAGKHLALLEDGGDVGE